MNKVYFETLGCPKNEVDTSFMENVLKNNKYSILLSPQEADIIFVNTCGFINDAKEESIETIFNLLQFKKIGNCKRLFLTGCLAQRYSNELLKEIPEIDGIIGPGYMTKINEFLSIVQNKKERISWVEKVEEEHVENIIHKKVNITEYIKISEGCNNNCSYCIIPSLRGRNRSRKIEDIISQVEYYVENGTREIVLVGQNTTDYGIDIYNYFALSHLLNELQKISNLKWIRILYAYPDNFDDMLIDSIVRNSKVLPYLDIPLQHASDKILSLMNRRSNKRKIKELITTLRKNIPNIVLRSTFIVGFPGETDEDFQELLDFIEEIKFDRLGAFMYSKEEGTNAGSMENQISEDIKKERIEQLMSSQSIISEKKMENYINSILEVLVEEQIEHGLYAGRSMLDAPEIDGVVYIKTSKQLKLNSFVSVKIFDSMEYDLIGEY